MSGGDVRGSAATESSSPADCPLCGGGNGCAMVEGVGNDRPCWCVAAVFGDALLARVPVAERGRACICKACAAAAAAAASGPPA